MKLELPDILLECMTTVDRLISLLEHGRADMPDCISGEILDEYNICTDEAMRIVREMKQTLRTMQELP